MIKRLIGDALAYMVTHPVECLEFVIGLLIFLKVHGYVTNRRLQQIIDWAVAIAEFWAQQINKKGADPVSGSDKLARAKAAIAEKYGEGVLARITKDDWDASVYRVTCGKSTKPP